MTVDNELYNRLSSTWWDENEPLNLLRTSLNPGRFGYFRDVLIKQLKIDPGERRHWMLVVVVAFWLKSLRDSAAR